MELTKAILDCMQLLRRRLRQEQALDIRLSQPGAVMSMLAACADSTIDETRELGERLSQLSGLRLAPPPPPVLSEAELMRSTPSTPARCAADSIRPAARLSTIGKTRPARSTR